MTRLPRRHVQRQALNHGRARTLLCPKSPQARPLPVKAKHKTTASSFDDEDEEDSSSSSDSDSESDHDSGYTSDSNIEAGAGYYHRMETRFRGAGPTMAVLGDSARIGMLAEQKKWKKFCEFTKRGNPKRRDPVAALAAAGSTPLPRDPSQPNAPEVMDTSTFKTYLTWRRDDSSGIKRQGSITTYWHSLSILYQQTFKDFLHGSILLDIKNWLPTLGLDDSDREKASLYVVDLCTLQNGLWVRDQEIFPHERLRVQESPLNIFSACTATRPAALVGEEPLLYENLEFQVFPPPIPGQPPIIILVLNLTNIKKSGGKKKPKKFGFYEGENIICCPVLFMIALAIADNAFKNKFTSLKQIYSLVVPSTTDRIRLKWDDDWKKRPIFRDVETTPNGVRISQTKSLKYQKRRRHLVRLGRTCRYRKKLQSYDWRRGSGKRLNEALSPEERRHIMGNRGDVYERYYMSSFIDADCQAIYLGTTRRDDLIRGIGRLERHEEAPDKLNEEQKLEISNNPEVVALIASRERYANEIKRQGYITIKDAKGTSWHTEHTQAQRTLNSLKSKLKDMLLDKTIDEFHETVHITEVDRQMLGIPPAEVLTPSNIEYELEERATVARLLFQPVEDLDASQLADMRVQLVQALTQLCHRQESPRQFKTSSLRISRQKSNGGIQELNPSSQKSDMIMSTEDMVTDGQQASTACIIDLTTNPRRIYCAFCKWGDSEAGPGKRDHVYRLDSLRRHVRAQHLERMDTFKGFQCPYEGCLAFLGGVPHFVAHARRQHHHRL